MIRACGLAIIVFWGVLLPPLICAQDVKPPAERMALQPLPVGLELQSQRLLDFLLQPNHVSVPLVPARDLSRYREFQLGMSLLAVAEQTDMKPSEARLVHQRPEVIQELEWRPQNFHGSTTKADPDKEVLFSFYNGELFRILVAYDQYKTEGLTDEDMVEAISTKYGAATRPAAKTILFSSFYVYNDTEKVMARWEDSQYSLNLFRSSYQPAYGMLILSKPLDALAQAAIAKAIRLDEQETAQQEIDQQKEKDEKDRVAGERQGQ